MNCSQREQSGAHFYLDKALVKNSGNGARIKLPKPSEGVPVSQIIFTKHDICHLFQIILVWYELKFIVLQRLFLKTPYYVEICLLHKIYMKKK